MAKTKPKQLAQARLAAIKSDPEAVIYKQFTAAVDTKRVDADQRTVTFVITTDAVDRDNDVIDPKGWLLDDFMKSPVVLWAHDYSMPPVARAIDVTPIARGLQSTAQFPEKGIYPFADMVFDLLKGGFLNASSVGFHPTEAEKAEDRDGINFTKQSLLEWSIVPVPANAEALVVARSKGVSLEPMKAWARKFIAASKDVPAPGTASDETICPACGNQYAGDQCPGCSHHEDPMDGAAVHAAARNVERVERIERGAFNALFKSMFDEPSTHKRRLESHDAAPDAAGDPVRWNRQLSKAFDVAGEPLAPASVELGWVSRYLETPIQSISIEGHSVPSARMGSYLSALDECLSAWTVDATRSLTYNGNEVPPEFESIKLNSKRSASFLVEGMRFMRRADGVRMAEKIERVWWGLQVTHYIRHDQSEVRTEWVQRCWQRAGELNFLKGEAFTLSGEFLERGDTSWTDLYLDPAQERVLRRVVERIGGEDGATIESRGVMLMGPPGTGKTLFGRVAMAQAKDVTYIHISARDFYRAGSFGAFTYAFDLAAECAPTMLFFEDVDNWLNSGEVIDLLKTEMDGLKRRKGILTALTTNFPELMPEALIDRPGRFHDIVEMNLPGEDVRVRMLKAWADGATADVLAQLAKDTDGFSGAHLRELTHYARTIALEEQVTLDEALPKALAKIREQRELIVSLRGGSDYRPRRVVRAAVAVAKGVVGNRLPWAVKAEEPTPQAGDQPQKPPKRDDDDEDDDKSGDVLVLDDEDGDIALELADDDESVVDVEDVRAAIGSALKSLLPTFVRTETQAALARARGRVD